MLEQTSHPPTIENNDNTISQGKQYMWNYMEKRHRNQNRKHHKDTHVTHRTDTKHRTNIYVIPPILHLDRTDTKHRTNTYVIPLILHLDCWPY